MGSSASVHLKEGLESNSDCSIVCNCFANDDNVKNRVIIRCCSSKWVWSHHHDNILTQCLTTEYYTFPMDIIYLIKDHTFCINKDYFTSKLQICHESYYSKLNQLLHKNLCSQWYMSQFATFQSFSIALIATDCQIGKHIVDGFVNHSLPALQLQSSSSSDSSDSSIIQTVRRTVFINNHQIPVKLLNINLNNNQFVATQSLKTAKVHLIILNSNDNVQGIDHILQKIRTINECTDTCYLLIRIIDKYKNSNYNNTRIISEEKQLCQNHNVSYIQTSLDCNQSIEDLFISAIKYYWFCMVK